MNTDFETTAPPGSTVALGMSGGVDSCATALILKERGYRVIGITLKVWEESDAPDRKWQERSCCKVGIARYVSQKLGIEHHVIDIRPDFRKAVIDDFVTGYLAGETPNPCIRCNERIKFGRLWDEARALGADYLATGHYVRLDAHPETGRPVLKKGRDPEKDQSYFLCRVRPELLPRL
ncbi:MAG TPA: tRNA 2-thiouridine(34) synthase MnmA, partial [Nitrospiria bacterium]|nr:tRNA 2-thiouridine(34) synthase MnmA [Nitrospiria bacterium]